MVGLRTFMRECSAIFMTNLYILLNHHTLKIGLKTPWYTCHLVAYVTSIQLFQYTTVSPKCNNKWSTIWWVCSASCTQHLVGHAFLWVWHLVLSSCMFAGMGQRCVFVDVCWIRNCCIKLIYGGLLVRWERWTRFFSWFDLCLIIKLCSHLSYH